MSSAAEFLSAALAEGGPRIVVVPAPILDPIVVLKSARKCEAWWLERPLVHEAADETLLGLGVARAIDLAHETLTDLHERVGGLASSVHPDCDATLAARLPITMFGQAFSPGARDEEPWTEHGDGRAVLPRWTYLRAGSRAVIAFADTQSAWTGRATLACAELEAIVGARGAPRARAVRARLEVSSPAAFHDRVEAARAAIARGELAKVVCSRRATVTADADLVAEDVLDRLTPSALRFFVRRGPSALLGATPERLFRKVGTKVWTEALAGTRAGGPTRSEEALLASEKDLSEHVPVVEAIVSRLSRLGADVRAESTPRLKHAANVVHLRTAIEARVPETTDAVALLEALHPTPAVGGSPREAAEAFIRAHEPPRGWYSGPIGWIDARGDADVHVMLRCAVVRGARAWVFAGGGIVASSEPLAELAETELKMAPMLRALGVEPAIEARASEPRATDATREPLGAETRA